MRMPPLIVYKLNRSTMNGTNSCSIALARIVLTKPGLHAACGRRHDMMRGPMAFEGAAVQERVVGHR